MNRHVVSLLASSSLGAALLCATAAQAQIDPAAAARAKAVEQSAFAAIDREHWCTAMDLFLEANSIVANADYIFNAAQAAEYGGDRARAVQLYTELLGHAPTAERKNAAKKKIKALTAEVEKKGAGPSCPPPAPKATAASPVPAPDVATTPPATQPLTPPSTATTPAAPATTATTPPAATAEAASVGAAPAPAGSEPIAVEALEPENAPEPPPPAATSPMLVPWVVTGVGGAVAIASGVGLAIGAGQYFSFVAAVGDQDNTDDRSSEQFEEATRRREFYAAEWNNWGQPLAIVSGVLLVAGLATAGVGGYLVVTE